MERKVVQLLVADPTGKLPPATEALVANLNLQLRINENVIAHLEDQIKELQDQVNELLELHGDRLEIATEKAFDIALAQAFNPFRIAFLETIVPEFRRGLQRRSTTTRRPSSSPKVNLPGEDRVAETVRLADLSEREREFLQILIAAKGEVVGQQGLFQRFGGREKIHKLLCSCRKKLRRANPASGQWIHTHYNLGYSLKTDIR